MSGLGGIEHLEHERALDPHLDQFEQALAARADPRRPTRLFRNRDDLLLWPVDSDREMHLAEPLRIADLSPLALVGAEMNQVPTRNHLEVHAAVARPGHPAILHRRERQ